MNDSKIVETIRNLTSQVWSCIPLPPHHCRYETWIQQDTAMSHWETAWKHGPEPPSLDFPRWFVSDFLIVDISRTVRSKPGHRHCSMAIQSVQVFFCYTHVLLQNGWKTVPTVLKIWKFKKERFMNMPRWPTIPKPWVAILGSALFSKPLYLGHGHFTSQTGVRYCGLLTLKADVSFHSILASNLNLFYSIAVSSKKQAPLAILNMSQTKTDALFAQIMFIMLPFLRIHHSFQHNDLKCDNIVVLKQPSLQSHLYVSFRIVSTQGSTKTLVLKIPTFGLQPLCIDYDHASFSIEPQNESIVLSDHPNSLPLRIYTTTEQAPRLNTRDIFMMFMSAPAAQTPNIVQSLIQNKFKALSPKSLFYHTWMQTKMDDAIDDALLTFASTFSCPSDDIPTHSIATFEWTNVFWS